MYIYILTLHAFFKMSQRKIKRKDIHNVLTIFPLLTNLLYCYIYAIYIYSNSKKVSIAIYVYILYIYIYV